MKKISSFEKPLDTKEHCDKRQEWVIDHYGLLTSEYVPVAYLDQKWLYRVNQQRALKVLPKGKRDGENVSVVKTSKNVIATVSY